MWQPHFKNKDIAQGLCVCGSQTWVMGKDIHSVYVTNTSILTFVWTCTKPNTGTSTWDWLIYRDYDTQPVSLHLTSKSAQKGDNLTWTVDLSDLTPTALNASFYRLPKQE